ncbi:MAG: hypothetical protein WD960_00500 [Gemmatimonadota bacterium]
MVLRTIFSRIIAAGIVIMAAATVGVTGTPEALAEPPVPEVACHAGWDEQQNMYCCACNENWCEPVYHQGIQYCEGPGLCSPGGQPPVPCEI